MFDPSNGNCSEPIEGAQPNGIQTLLTSPACRVPYISRQKDSREARIRVPFFLWCILVGEPSPKKDTTGDLATHKIGNHWLLWAIKAATAMKTLQKVTSPPRARWLMSGEDRTKRRPTSAERVPGFGFCGREPSGEFPAPPLQSSHLNPNN